jgi:ABC-type oligopeptide transport system ATPase subunit
VDDVLELVGLPASVRERRPAELSGGQQQRAGVSRRTKTARFWLEAAALTLLAVLEAAGVEP